MSKRNPLAYLRLHGRRMLRSDHGALAVLSVVIGLAVAAGVIGFRDLLDAVRFVFLGFSEESVVTLVADQPWWRVLLAPAAGGLLVGLLTTWWLGGERAEGVPQVMEASALRGARMPLLTGVKSALISALSLGAGASTGREGPAVHIGATIGAQIALRLGLSESLSRTLLGCGVAAAVAGSFNAPFAGVFFALEVVVGHYALSAFAPIVLASVTATIVVRGHYGDFPAFILPDRVDSISFVELPFFTLLGLLSAGAAALFMFLVVRATRYGDRLAVPMFVKPALGGLVIGAMALAYPHLLGVGYQATDLALKEQLALGTLLALVALKMLATAISIGAGFGGGVFSPSLFLGAMLGGGFGDLITRLLPSVSSGANAYTLVGMGAVSAVVLGAPISTILIMFEMTGDYKLTVAVMVAVVVAGIVNEMSIGESLFTWQLKERGITLKGGREREHLARIRVGSIMKSDFHVVPPTADVVEVTRQLRSARFGEIFVVDADGRLLGLITSVDLVHATEGAGQGEAAPATAASLLRRDPPVLTRDDSLDDAIDLMDGAGESHVPVVDTKEDHRLIGFLHEHDVMLAYHRAVVEARVDKPGERPGAP